MSDPNRVPEPAEPAHPTPPPATPDPTLAYEPPASPRPMAPGAPPTGAPVAPSWGYRQPPWQPGQASFVAPTPTECNWAVAAHLSSFVASLVGLGFLGPLVIMLTEGNRSPFVRRHAVEALNFNLTLFGAIIVSAILVLVLVGVLMLLGLLVLYVAASIAGAVAASRGRDFRYPFTIRLVS